MIIRVLFVVLLLLSAPVAAHHGSAICTHHEPVDDVGNGHGVRLQNPHPTMNFDRTTKDGKVEHWVSELLTNPSVLVRAGWTRARSNEALKPGTRVKLYLGTSRAGGHSGIVMKIENEKGETTWRSGRREGGRRSRWSARRPATEGRQEVPGQSTGGRS